MEVMTIEITWAMNQNVKLYTEERGKKEVYGTNKTLGLEYFGNY